ncbi:type VI secretion system baseplate subunit TssE [Xylophilus sp. GOD-11R]|uniref:type VI secretion system baseplate subunit TssE n=1 Tax=Xylophilus sp. GOD-11R TaxID=3089814 RepID=UPI00298BE447|nr:GPW/gp25 family protein [Xylophilus sp. GOD-11R]WPB55353.1 GPW/gp25 family protein [Xylophilus sp. GOD-11R]
MTPVIPCAHHPAARYPAGADTGHAGRTARAEPLFLPTLFDRLQDDEPSDPHESPRAYAPGRDRMRELVRRDLELLLCTVNLEDRLDRTRRPLVAASTVNYGLPPLAGGWALERRWPEVENMIRRALTDFEPRLSPDTLCVRPLADGGRPASLRLLRFEISGEIRIAQYPLVFRVQTAVDLETSRITLET